MRKPKQPPGSPDDTEAAFYEALQQADIERAKDQAMRVVTIGSRWDLEGGHGQGACRAG